MTSSAMSSADDWMDGVYLNQPTEPFADEFTRIVCDEWFGTVCPEGLQNKLFAWLFERRGGYTLGRTLCNDLESDAPRYYTREALIVAAVHKYFPGHTDVKPVAGIDDIIFQGKNADGDDTLFIFKFLDHGYHLSLSLLGSFKLREIPLPCDDSLGETLMNISSHKLALCTELHCRREDHLASCVAAAAMGLHERQSAGIADNMEIVARHVFA